MIIPLPSKLEIKEAKNNRAEIIIEPCYPGFGVTIGNALRRVLFSSLEGAAVTAFKINGVMHEFSSLPNIKEDLVEMILNLKNIRIKSYTNELVVLKLKVKGEKTVTAGDIEKNSQAEPINKNQIIATLTDKSAELDMELFIQKGKGYVTVEDRANEKVDLGVIILDSLFSPVTNVGFEVEHVRVGERTDYDRLIIKMETDGSMTCQEAMEKSADILVEHFNFIKGLETKELETKGIEIKPETEKDHKKSVKIEKEEKTEAETATEDKPKRKRGRPRKTVT